MPAGKPDAELAIDENLVRRLLIEQHPDLADLPLNHLDSGWDNVMYRLGDRLTVRVPRRRIAAQLLVNEQTWLPGIAERLPVPIPTPVRLGQPTEIYPWHWSVLPWFDGVCADVERLDSSQADRFAEFLLALHTPAPEDAPKNPVRGIPLEVRQANTQERLSRVKSRTDLISPPLELLWEHAVAAPLTTDAKWLHGDLHALNVLVSDGQLSAVIDWGDVTSGDVATDLAGIWALFDDPCDRERIIDLYQPDAATLERARGWAFLFGVVLLDSGLINNPRTTASGRQMLKRLAAG